MCSVKRKSIFVQTVRGSLKKSKSKRNDINIATGLPRNWVCDYCENEAMLRSFIDKKVTFRCSKHIDVREMKRV